MAYATKVSGGSYPHYIVQRGNNKEKVFLISKRIIRNLPSAKVRSVFFLANFLENRDNRRIIGPRSR
jgi:hypothetical protein